MTYQDIDHIGGEPALTQEAGHDSCLKPFEDKGAGNHRGWAIASVLRRPRDFYTRSAFI